MPSLPTILRSKLFTRRTYATHHAIPVIDISCFNKNNATPLDTSAKKNQVAQQIYDACCTLGCFYAVGHGIEKGESENMLKASKHLFALPDEVKCGIPLLQGGFNRGYIKLGAESGSDRYEVKEGFSYGYNWDPVQIPRNALQGANIWPDDPRWDRKHQDSMCTFFDRMADAAGSIVNAISLSLGKSEECLGKICDEGHTISLMRLMHYFPYDKISTEKECIGSSPHTDWGFLTLISQDDVGGLEIFFNNRWIKAPVVEGSLFVNCGDYLSMLTRGKFKSPIHRVHTPTVERYSMVFFFYPNYDTKIDMFGKLEGIGGGLKNELYFNNLFDGTVDDETLAQGPFGDFILKKWDSVYRT